MCVYVSRELGQVCVPPVCVCVLVCTCMCACVPVRDYVFANVLMCTLYALFVLFCLYKTLQCTCDYESCAYVCVSKPPGVVRVYESVCVCVCT